MTSHAKMRTSKQAFSQLKLSRPKVSRWNRELGMRSRCIKSELRYGQTYSRLTMSVAHMHKNMFYASLHQKML